MHRISSGASLNQLYIDCRNIIPDKKNPLHEVVIYQIVDTAVLQVYSDVNSKHFCPYLKITQRMMEFFCVFWLKLESIMDSMISILKDQLRGVHI